LEQSYIMTIKPIGRPAECSADVGEPGDDEVDGAQAVAIDQTVEGVRCLGTDTDHFAVTVPADHTGVVTLNFTHENEGNLKLELLDSLGNVEASSDESGYSNGVESIEILPDGNAQTRIVRVSLSSTISITTAQTYTVEASSYDSSACVASEPDSNNIKVEATSIKPSDSFTGTLQACEYDDGSGGTSNDCHMCGHTDEDWYHLGKLYADQTVTATLTHDATAGVLGMQLRRSSSMDSTTASTMEMNNNSQSENVITVDHTESATLQSGNEYEYYVKVYAEGTTGHEAQTYQLAVDFSEACLPDAYEGSTLNNSTSNATVGRDGTTGDLIVSEITEGTLCTGDVDYFTYFLNNGESITVTPGTGDTIITIINSAGDVLGELNDNADAGPTGLITYQHNGAQSLNVWVKIERTETAVGNAYTASVNLD
jgi:hypothetical protein